MERAHQGPKPLDSHQVKLVAAGVWTVKVGILELLLGVPTTRGLEGIGHHLITKQYASIMPQAIAAWCRQLGHEVFYATYYGQSDPKGLLPDDLDIVFIGCYTRASALAYALSKLYQKERTRTVIGGPHAKSFPDDCLRFFDLVVLQCDKTVVSDILSGVYSPHTIISSGRTLSDLPSVEERMPEIKASAFSRSGRPSFSTIIPMLASVGCPYACNFCTDWNNPYSLLPLDRLEADLRYLSHHWPGVKLAFHDPNFAVKFDQTLEVMERLPPNARNPYIVESSLSLLRGSRLERLRDTNCIYIAPGIESWSSYSNKTGVGKKSGAEKVMLLADHLKLLHKQVPGIQVNFIFGLDTDEGDEPVELTKQFIRQTSFAWPVINIPMPFGGTPLFDQYLDEGRILESVPFTFYYFPYLVTTLKNYDPLVYYQKLLDLLVYSVTGEVFWRRQWTTPSWTLRFFYLMRTLGMGRQVQQVKEILKTMTADPQFLAFHRRESAVLPEFYHREYERQLGRYAGLMSREDRTPVLTPASTVRPLALVK